MTTVSHWCRTCTNHPTPLSQPSTHLLHKTPHMCSEQEKFSWYITYPYIYTCQQMSTAHERYVWHHTQELCEVAGLKLPLVAYINELRSLTAISLLITGVWTSAKTKTRVRSRFFLSYLTFFLFMLYDTFIYEFYMKCLDTSIGLQCVSYDVWGGPPGYATYTRSEVMFPYPGRMHKFRLQHFHFWNPDINLPRNQIKINNIVATFTAV